MAGRARLAAAVSAVLLLAGGRAWAQPQPFKTGDVFASTGSGVVFVYRADPGTGKHVFTTDLGYNQETPVFGLNTQTGGTTTGSAFDSAGNFYVTTFTSAPRVFRFTLDFDVNGTPTSFDTGGDWPESVLFDLAGNMIVGHAGLPKYEIRKFTAGGTPLDVFPAGREAQGTDWIDLAADQRTLFYTSEGRRIRRYDLVSKTQLPDFADLTNVDAEGGKLFALRILSDGTVLAADNVNVKHLGADGTMIRTYDVVADAAAGIQANDAWFSLNLDPDTTSFWSGDSHTGQVHKFDIASGQLLDTVFTGFFDTLFGVSVFREITQATQPRCQAMALVAANVTGSTCSTLMLSATLTCSGAPVAGKTIAFSLNGSAAGSAVTNDAGVATESGVPAPAVAGVFPGGVTATFAGDAGFMPASGTANLVLADGCLPALTLTKAPNPTTYASAGEVITYTYRITNTGTIALEAPFTIADDRLGTFPCSTAATLASAASVTCTRDYVITASNLGNAVTALPNAVSATASYGEWMQGATSSFDVSIGGATGLADGLYPAWCVEAWAFEGLENHPVTLYSTVGADLPADVAGWPWGKINYLLNHKIHGAHRTDAQFIEDVQAAVWLLLRERPDASIAISPVARRMVAEANLHADFVPAQGDVVAVLVYSDGIHRVRASIQESVIEMKPLQKIVNHAVATARAGDSTVTSNKVEAMVTQVAPGAPVGPMDAVASGHQPVAGETVTVTTAAFSTTANHQLLLAFVAADYARGPNTQVTSVTGAGLTWELVVRSNRQPGTSEIWRAFAAEPLTDVTVTAAFSQAVASSITIVSFRNVDASGANGSGAIGAIAGASGPTGAPTVTLATTRDRSWVFGVGNDFDRRIGRTVGAGQALVYQYMPPAVDTFWVQRSGEIAQAGTTTTLHDVAPTTDRWNFAAVEVLIAGTQANLGVTPPARHRWNRAMVELAR